MLGWIPQVKDSSAKEPYPAWAALSLAELTIPGRVVGAHGHRPVPPMSNLPSAVSIAGASPKRRQR